MHKYDMCINRKGGNMVRVTITIPEELKEKLEKLAQEQDRSLSYIVREMLQKELNEEEE